MTGTRVVIDADPGVDDAAAILLAIASTEIDLVGITTVAGNVALHKTTKNALRICELAGVDVPVAAGADRPLVQQRTRNDEQSVHGVDGLGGKLHFEPQRSPVTPHAIDFIAEQAEAAPLSIIGIGPLTNLALLLARYPQIATRIERFVIMGGARLEGNATPAAEFNIWSDPEAAARVFASGIPITLFPLDITHQAVLTADEVEQLSATGRVGAALAQLIRFYEHNHLDNYGAHFCPLHDVLATLYLAHPGAMTFIDAQVTIDCGASISRGATLVNTSHNPVIVKNVSVGVDLDRETFARALLDRIAQLDDLTADAGRRRRPGRLHP